MDERSAARRPNLELVRNDRDAATSAVVAAQAESAVGTTTLVGVKPGVLLEGKYLVGRIIGSGAVGIVFEAKNVELDETVAIKCLRPEMLVDKVMVARFAREAKAAAAIKSEYVATVHDVGTTAEGVPYIVMEYLDGKDLGVVVAELGSIGPRTAVEYALQVCEALAVAHSKGIVHRDIKPENLLLTERAGGMRIVKVLDFGISKTALTGSIFQNELPLVKTVNLMGTPLYMSPEQVRVSDSVDVRSDIWSLGMVIYEILTGQTAFSGTSITEICAAILEAPPKPIEQLRSDLAPGLIDVISVCLQKDANKRYQNIAELALALMPFGPKRTRLNVERAVAVLQGSGQLDPKIRVSTVPPAPSDFSLTPIPRAPSVPGVSSSGLIAAPSSSSSIITRRIEGSTSRMVPGAGEPSRTAASLAASAETTIAYPERKTPVGLILGAVALLLAAGVAIAIIARSDAKAVQRVAAEKQAPVVVAAPVATTPAAPTATPMATADVRPSATTPSATILTQPQPQPQPAAPRPFPWARPGSQPHTGAGTRAASATSAALPPQPAPLAAPPPTAKPRTGKPGEGEPDLGY